MTGAHFGDNLLQTIREHTIFIIVDRTQRAGEKLIDKSLGLSIDEKNELYI